MADPSPRGEASAMRFRILDSTGAIVARGGRQGQGPGELTSPVGFFFRTDSTLSVFDAATLRVSEFRGDGRFTSSLQFGGPWFPKAVLADSVDVAVPQHPEVEYRRLAMTGLQGRRLFLSRDSAYDSVFPKGNAQSPTGPIRPAASYAAAPGGIAVGNGETWRILLYSPSGRLTGSIRREVPVGLPTEAEVAKHQKEIDSYRGPDGRPMSPGMKARLIRTFRTTPKLRTEDPF